VSKPAAKKGNQRGADAENDESDAEKQTQQPNSSKRKKAADEAIAGESEEEEGSPKKTKINDGGGGGEEGFECMCTLKHLERVLSATHMKILNGGVKIFNFGPDLHRSKKKPGQHFPASFDPSCDLTQTYFIDERPICNACYKRMREFMTRISEK